MKRDEIKKVLIKLWPRIRPFKIRLLCGIILLATTTSLDLLGPILIGKAADSVVSSPPDSKKLFHICLTFLILITAKAFSEMLQAFTIQTTGLLITQRLRLDVFDRIIRFKMSYFDEHSSGRLITRVINDVRSLSELFSASMSVLALDVLIIVGTLISMYVLDWKLATVVLVTFPIVIWVIIHFGKLLSNAYREARNRLSEINSFLGENIAAMPTIHRLSAEGPREQSFVSIVNKHQSALVDSIQAYAQVQPWANVLNGIAMGTLLGVGGTWVIQGKIKVGILVAFLAYIRNLFQPIRDLVEKYNMVLSAFISAERVAQVFDEEGEDLSECQSELPQVGKPCSVRFEKVSFKYKSREEMALSDISFHLEAGKRLAIVGATGSGKSTIVKLLLRFYELKSGEIFLGEVPISHWSKKALRTHLGFIPQDVYLFEGTVRENLKLSRSDLTDEFLIEQCQKAQAWECIEKRGGLDLRIDEGGHNLSLGERQLISFARTLVLDPEILVMDEATASLDNASEARLMKAVEEVLKGRTSVIIAHRLSTIENCDKVIVLENGELKEEGSIPELLSRKGIFEKFYLFYKQSSRQNQ
jgi:ATP-binding cassette subfamily B protein